jgi:hypothetical protein
VAGSFEHGKEISGSIKGREFLDYGTSATASFSIRTPLHTVSCTIVLRRILRE